MAPESFGKYKVTRRIGQGGMAAVYEAVDPMLDRRVAIKVVHPHLASEGNFAERFRQEARLVASLRHAHIVLLYDFDIIDDQHFMVMEYLDGGTLKDRIVQLRSSRQTVPLGQVGRLLNDLASALDYAHSRGAVHRDIKPANILFTAQREAVISDFGIAKILSETAQLSATGALIGTPAYMSPEQAGGERIDARSDIYSLGVMIYEMAAGRVPYVGETPTAIIMQHLTSTPPPPRTFNPNVPLAVQQVILQALSRKRENRFESAGDFASAFQAALVGETTASPELGDAGDATEVDDSPFEVTSLGNVKKQLPEQETEVDDRALLRETIPGTGINIPETEPGPEQETEIDENSLRPQSPPLEKTPPPQKKKQVSPKRWRRWILGGAAAAVTLLIVAFAFTWWTGLNTEDEAVALPDVLPRFTIAIAEFENAGANENIDFARRIFEGMGIELAAFGSEVRLVRTNEMYADTDEAVAAMLENGAIMIVWGWYDDAGVNPFIELVDSVGVPDPGNPILSPALASENDLTSPGDIALQSFSQYVRRPKLGSRLDLFVDSGAEQLTYVAAASLGLAYQLEGDTETALSFFNKAIENAPELPPGAGDTFGLEFVRFYRAALFTQRGEIENAIADLEESVAIAPDLFESYFNLALLYPQVCFVEQPLDRAVVAAETAVDLIPDDAGVLSLLGSLLAQTGDYSRAEQLIQTALEYFPDDAAGYLLLGDVLDALEDATGAADAWQTARILLEDEIMESGPAVDLLLALGDAALRLGDNEGALDNYMALANYSPDHPGIFQGVGSVYMLEGDFNRARQEYEKWVVLDPMAARAHFLVGVAALRAGDDPAAVESLQRSSALFPCDPAPDLMIGSILWRQGDYPSAIESFNNAVANSTNDPDAHYLLGSSYLSDGQADDAIPELEKTLELDPEFAPARNALASAFYQTGDFEKAREHWQRLTEEYPLESVYFTFLGNAYEKLENYGAAIAAYQQSLEITEDSNVRLFLAFIFRSLGELLPARENLEIAVENSPEDPLALGSLGDLYAQLGQRVDAAVMYERALAVEENALLHAQLGATYAPLGRVDEAISQYEQAAALEPENELFLGPLAILYSYRGRLDDSENVYQDWISVSPENPQPYVGLGQLAYKQCDFDSQFDNYSFALEKAPGASLYQSLVGFALESRGDDGAAAEVFSSLESQMGDDFLTRLLVGEYYLRQGEVATSLEIFEALSAFETTSPFFQALLLYDLGSGYFLQDRRQEAKTVFESAVMFYPQYADAYVSLGDLALLEGNFQEAIDWYLEGGGQLSAYAWEVSGDGARILGPAINIRLYAAYLQMGETGSAEEAFASGFEQISVLLSETPDWPQVRLLHGFLNAVNGDQTFAAGEYAGAVACDRSLEIGIQRLNTFVAEIRP